MAEYNHGDCIYILPYSCVHVRKFTINYVVSQEMEEAWSRKYQEFKQHWAHLSAAIKGSAIEPIEVDCTADPETMEHSTVMDLEGTQHLQYYILYCIIVSISYYSLILECFGCSMHVLVCIS